MSKGSNRRPTDEDTYKANYDAIFSKKPAQMELPLSPCKHDVWTPVPGEDFYACIACGVLAGSPTEGAGIA